MANPEESSGATSIATNRKSEIGNRKLVEWGLLALPLGYLWFHLIDNLRLEWTTDPQ